MTQPVSEDTLDQLLSSAAVAAPDAVVAAAQELAIITRHAAHEPFATARPRRRRPVVLGVAGAALLLSGAGTVAAYQLSMPPFQTLEPGIYRVRPAIVVDYTERDGRPRQCRVFAEFLNLTEGQQDAAVRWAEDQDWTGYGERLVATAGTTAEADIFELVRADIRDKFATQMVPGVDRDALRADKTGVAGLAGSAMSCRAVTDDG